MLSNKTKYALKALQVLAKEYGQGPVLISEIARRETIPPKFLELILLELKNQGILQSKKGKGGGYFLSRTPQSVSMGQIVRIMEGSIGAAALRQQDLLYAMPRMPRRAQLRDPDRHERRARCHRANPGFHDLGRRAQTRGIGGSGKRRA